MGRTKRIYSIAGVAALLVVLLVVVASSSGLFDDEQAFIPADQVRTAIETAAAEQPGDITGAFVEREEGITMVEVFIRSNGGMRIVEVDAQTGRAVEVEDGMEDHFANMDEARGYISAEQAQRSIEVAVTGQAGDVGGFVVEREEGTVMSEIFVKDAGGTVYSVEVDVNTGEVVEVEEGTEEHIE